MKTPKLPGRYAVLVFEWTGGVEDKPTSPEWHIKEWDGKEWQRKRYYYDTGNMENLQVVTWKPLPLSV